MAEMIRERIEAAGIIEGRMHETMRSAEAIKSTAYRLHRIWLEGNLIPADEVQARIDSAVSEAVREERARCATLIEDHAKKARREQQRLGAAQLEAWAKAIRKEPDHD